MAKHNALHPGIQAYLRGRQFCVRFRQHGIEKRKSLQTSDAGLAEKYCRVIFGILKGEPYELRDVPKVIQDALCITEADQHFSVAIKATEAAMDGLEQVWSREPEPNTPEHGEYLKNLEEHEAAIAKAQDLAVVIDKQGEALNGLQRENHSLKNRIKELESLLSAAGREQLAKVTPKTLRRACDDYLANGTAAGERAKKDYRNLLEGLVSKIGSDFNIVELPPKKVIEYFEEQKAKACTSRVRQCCNIVIAMFKNQSQGFYPVQLLQEWRKLNCKEIGKEGDDFFWLEEKDVLALAKEAKKTSIYWHDAILIQYAIAARPEELTLIQTSNIDLKNTPPSVYIGPLKDGEGKIIRNVKTAGSRASLPIAKFAIEAFERRIATRGIVLFHRDKKTLKLKEQPRHKLSDFEFDNSIWTPNAFCKSYLEVLRDSATKLGLNSQNIDCRTLRRSRGRDMIIKTQSAEKAATFLRDNLITVSRFYARWLPRDIEV